MSEGSAVAESAAELADQFVRRFQSKRKLRLSVGRAPQRLLSGQAAEGEQHVELLAKLMIVDYKAEPHLVYWFVRVSNTGPWSLVGGDHWAVQAALVRTWQYHSTMHWGEAPELAALLPEAVLRLEC